jgi:anti-sigma factor RsiW
MQSALDQLDDQAILLLYIADELSQEDRSAVEARLGAEENLRAELENIRGAHSSVMQSLAGLDAQRPIAVRTAAAQRNVLRQLKQWHVQRLSPTSETTKRAPKHRHKIPWLLPLSGVAAALMGVIIFWGWTSNPQLPMEYNLPTLPPDRTSLRISLQLDSRDNSLADDEQEMDVLSDLRSITR